MQEPERPIEVVREEAYSRATRQRAERAINIEDFRKIREYGDPNVDFDNEYVREHDQLFLEKETPDRREAKKIAETFEGIWQDLASQGWMGRDATAVTPSHYDDVKNGIDSIVEFKTGPRSATHLAMGIDVTFSVHPGQKLERATNELARNKLAEVKYFKSPHLGEHKKLRDLPRVVIGIEREQVDRLAKLWLSPDQQALREDPIQLVLLDEIKMQLVAFKKFAERKGGTKALPHLDRMEKIIDGLLAQKSELRKQKGQEVETIKQKDRVYLAMEVFLKNLNPTATT